MTTKILAVDDSRTMREMLRACLSGAGYDVVTAERGQDGLEVLERESPNVIITDINMPVMDGFEFIKGVRSIGSRSRIPILVLSTESGADKKTRAREAGATGWIVKPFEPEKLVSAIRRVLPERTLAEGYR